MKISPQVNTFPILDGFRSMSATCEPDAAQSPNFSCRSTTRCTVVVLQGNLPKSYETVAVIGVHKYPCSQLPQSALSNLKKNSLTLLNPF